MSNMKTEKRMGISLVLYSERYLIFLEDNQVKDKKIPLKINSEFKTSYFGGILLFKL